MAHNRERKSQEAENVLRRVLASHGPSPETLGLLGRGYKDRWRRVSGNGPQTGAQANTALDEAVKTCCAGSSRTDATRTQASMPLR